jgi:hypothetical protein
MNAKIRSIVFAPSTLVRIRSGSSNEGTSFSVKISEKAPVSLCRLKKTLEKVVDRFCQAPYYELIKGKAINVWVVTEEEFKKLGIYKERIGGPYTAPEVNAPIEPVGVYDPILDAVLINSSRMKSEENEVEVLLHEMLHAYSARMEDIGGGALKIRMGLMAMEGRREPRRLVEIEGRGLNEGVTEYLRVGAGIGGERFCNEYYPLYQAVALLAQRFGRELLWESYFQGETQRLRRAVDGIYGSGAYEKLSDLADHARKDPDKWNVEMLIGFAKFGFEHFIMKSWGYSPENLMRAPRQISAESLPAAIRKALEGTGIKIYTNLTEEELELFSTNVTEPEKHRNPDSFKIFGWLPSWIRKELSMLNPGLGMCLNLFYRKEKEPHVLVGLEAFDLEDLNLPYALGRETKGFHTLLSVSL